MSDFGKRGKRGAGEQEGEPGDWWLLEKDLAEISLSHRSALLLTPKAKESFYEMLSNRQNIYILSEAKFECPSLSSIFELTLLPLPAWFIQLIA